jgi:hypothetical protein
MMLLPTGQQQKSRFTLFLRPRMNEESPLPFLTGRFSLLSFLHEDDMLAPIVCEFDCSLKLLTQLTILHATAFTSHSNMSVMLTSQMSATPSAIQMCGENLRKASMVISVYNGIS